MPSIEAPSQPKVTLREKAHNFVFRLADRCAVVNPVSMNTSSIRRTYMSLRASEIVEAIYTVPSLVAEEVLQDEKPLSQPL